MKKDFTILYCFVDDFIKNFEQDKIAVTSSKSKTGVPNYFSSSEVLTASSS
jgi:hypothetical protein